VGAEFFHAEDRKKGLTDGQTSVFRNFANAPKYVSVAEVGKTVTVSKNAASSPRAGYVQCHVSEVTSGVAHNVSYSNRTIT
jgi:hypothetical protein